MPLAAVGGTDLYYLEVGSGPPALILHGGLGFDHVLYRGLDPLGARLRLVYFDQRCHGRSARPELDTITMEQLADDAAGVVSLVGREPAVVVGHSYGGFVAQELALRHPEAVRALVLVSTTAGQLGASDDPNFYQGPPPPPQVAEILSRPPVDDDDFRRLAGSLLRVYLHRADPAPLAAMLAGAILEVGPLYQGFQVLAGWSAVDRLAQVAAPTLVLAGRHDVVTSPPQAERIASHIPGAQLTVLGHSGHMPWVDEPAAFFATVEAFLRNYDVVAK